MKKLAIAAMSAGLCTALCATQYSKLALITAAKTAGRWDAAKAWIASSGFEDEWNAAQYVSDEYPQFAAITNALVTSGVVSPGEIALILEASRDTAVSDAMLATAVSNDCQSAEGRVRWHGKLVETVIDTNALTRTRIYADGWTWTTKFSRARPPSLDDQLSAAERKARRQEAAERARQARIAELQTNMVALAESLAARRRYPLELATMLLQHELNTLVGTNEVTVIVSP